jgi:hypothetical protein
MTLIVAAICQNGVFIRSDKRRKVKNTSGSIDCYDDMQKVFVSTDRKIIIYNHGINVIKGKSWYELAVKSARYIRENRARNIETALNIIESAISAEILDELSNNKLSDFCAFVVILKTKGKKWYTGEISWKNKHGVEKILHGRFIRSGSGNKYFYPDNKQKENAYWESIRVREAKAKIAVLWSNAIKNQSNAQGDDFSSSYDDVMIT